MADSYMVTVRRDDLAQVLRWLRDWRSEGHPELARLRGVVEKQPDPAMHVHVQNAPDGPSFGAGLAAGYEEGRRSR